MTEHNGSLCSFSLLRIPQLFSANTKALTTMNSNTEASRGTRRPRRYRTPISCRPCRQSKLRCDRQTPCASCRRRNCVAQCRYTHEIMAPAAAQPDGGNLATQTSPLSVPLQSPDSSQRDETNGSQPTPPSDFSTFGDASLQQHQDQPHRNLYQDFTQSHWDAVLQRPTDHTRRSTLASQGTLHQPEALYFPFPLASEVTVNDLISALPPRESCEYLIIRYFTCISPFFHILHGPTFQKQFAGFFKDTSSCDLSWLALLFLICSATLKTIDKGDDVIHSIASSSSHSPNIAVISDRYRAMAMICLCKDRFLVRYRLSTLEALLVLVYTISHNEGAEQSWVILGQSCHALFQAH